tara:strand:+ start:72 stop:1040 length:969 start_codon:yes stop_codon:yes gene_type:complete
MIYNFVKSYFIDDFYYDYWHCPHPTSCEIKNGDYPINFQYKTNFSGEYDKNGIPLLDLSSQHWSKSRESIYSPIVISQFALGHYSKYIEKNSKESLEIFIHCAQWILDNSSFARINNQDTAIFYISLDSGSRYKSGMAQGLAISVLCRYYLIKNQAHILRKIILLLRPMTIAIEKGGLASRLGDGFVIEEWSHENYKIFNGHLFALIGILELKKVFPKNNKLLNLSRKLKLSSLNLAKKIDIGTWTLYSLKPGIIKNISSYFYHNLHINLMKGIYILEDDIKFKNFADRWNLQRNSIFNKLYAMIYKIADIFFYQLKLRLKK